MIQARAIKDRRDLHSSQADTRDEAVSGLDCVNKTKKRRVSACQACPKQW